MSLLYTHTYKKNPQNKTAMPKVYLVSRTRGRMEMKDLLDMVCNDSTIDPYEVRLAVHRLVMKMKECLKMGFTVHIDELGYFLVYIQSEGSDSIEEATTDKITNKHITFCPAPDFHKEIQDIKMVKLL